MTKDKAETIDFEAALKQLTQLLEKMESGSLSLEESIKLFEEGVGLVRTCQSVLQTAEQRVMKLMEKKGELTLEKFDDNHA